MAKWKGGRGAVAYDNLPEAIREEFLKRRPDKKETAPKPAQETPSTEGSLKVGEIDLKATERGAGYVTYTWRAEVLNGTDLPQEVRARIKLFDKEGFELDLDYGDTIYIKAKQRGSVTGQGFVKEALWNAVENYRISLE